MSTLTKNTTELKCDKCQHSWNTKSVLNYVTCPSCQRKMNAKKYRWKKFEFFLSELVLNAHDAALSNPPFGVKQKPKENSSYPRGFRPGRWEALK